MRLTNRGRTVLSSLAAIAMVALGVFMTGPATGSVERVPYSELPDTAPAWNREEALENCKVYTELGWPSEEMSCRQAAHRTDW